MQQTAVQAIRDSTYTGAASNRLVAAECLRLPARGRMSVPAQSQHGSVHIEPQWPSTPKRLRLGHAPEAPFLFSSAFISAWQTYGYLVSSGSPLAAFLAHGSCTAGTGAPTGTLRCGVEWSKDVPGKAAQGGRWCSDARSHVQRTAPLCTQPLCTVPPPHRANIQTAVPDPHRASTIHTAPQQSTLLCLIHPLPPPTPHTWESAQPRGNPL